MPINPLYHTWINRIRQIQPTERITRIYNFVSGWLLGFTKADRSTCTELPGKVKLLRIVQRLSRLLANPGINDRKWYEPVARAWLEQ